VPVFSYTNRDPFPGTISSIAFLWHINFNSYGMDEINPAFIGIVAGVFSAASLLPQLVKIIREKKAHDISISMFLLLFTGLALWIFYGIMKKDLPLILTNAVSLATNALIIYFSLKYKKREQE
jgi:MtN3 and saliva related transmembrane protein